MNSSDCGFTFTVTGTSSLVPSGYVTTTVLVYHLVLKLSAIVFNHYLLSAGRSLLAIPSAAFGVSPCLVKNILRPAEWTHLIVVSPSQSLELHLSFPSGYVYTTVLAYHLVLKYQLASFNVGCAAGKCGLRFLEQQEFRHVSLGHLDRLACTSQPFLRLLLGTGTVFRSIWVSHTTTVHGLGTCVHWCLPVVGSSAEVAVAIPSSRLV